jgi:hypothetical protein
MRCERCASYLAKSRFVLTSLALGLEEIQYQWKSLRLAGLQSHPLRQSFLIVSIRVILKHWGVNAPIRRARPVRPCGKHSPAVRKKVPPLCLWLGLRFVAIAPKPSGTIR